MRTIFSVLIMMFVIEVAVGQKKVAAPCPTISVTGPAGIAEPGEVVEFSAALSGPIPSNAKYSWSVSDGEIISGGDTLLVRVRTPKANSIKTTASVNIIGLPSNCTHT